MAFLSKSKHIKGTKTKQCFMKGGLQGGKRREFFKIISKLHPEGKNYPTQNSLRNSLKQTDQVRQTLLSQRVSKQQTWVRVTRGEERQHK